MEWTSPWGKTRFGRTPAGAWGSKFLDNSAQGDRLMWWLNMLPENWGSLIFTQKVKEVDAAGGVDISDADQDAYYVDLSYKADFGKTTGALWLVRTADATPSGSVTTSMYWMHGNYTFDALNVEYELRYIFGDSLPNTAQGFDQAGDANAFGFYTDASWKVQDWKFGGLFIWASGDDDPTDNEVKSVMSNATGLGKDFNPYQILTGDYMRVLNGDMGGLSPDSIHPAIKNGNANAGVWSLGGYAQFAMSPTVSFNAIVGYAAAAQEPEGYDSDYGWEIGIGMGYKIMDNLMYNAHFSYMITGDYFKEGVSDATTEDVYLVAHALSMKF
jgi:hypothetical protein